MLVRALILGICFSFFGGMICDFSTVYASNTGTESVEQNRKKKKKSTKKKTYKKKSNSNVSSFGQAYRDARKKGLKTFKHNGKTYTTEKDTDSKKNVTSNNKKTNRESASYKNVSFGSAYKDAKKRGLSTFTWNGKKYTTEKTVKKNTKSNKKKYTKSKKKSNKKYSKKRKTSKKRYTTTKRKSSNTYKSSNNSYTPPPKYENDNSGREYKRESSNDNSPVKKEPKKE